LKEKAHCSARHLNHVCIAVRNIEETLEFYDELFGLEVSGSIEHIEDQSVKAALVRIGGSQLEFIEPTDPSGPISKFIDDRGETVHHICFEVENLDQKLTRLKEIGYRMVDKQPRQGLSGQIGFIHPKSTRGVLIELVDQKTARR